MASKKVDVATALQGLDLTGTATKEDTKKDIPNKAKQKKQAVKSSILLNFGDVETKENIKLLADVKGCSMTEYILNLIEEDVKAKDQLIKDIKKLRNKASNN